MREILIKGGTILSMDDKIGDLHRGDILIPGEKISRVAKTIRAPNAKLIDARDKIVLPGLINAHIHTWQTNIRGIAGNWSIPEYLHNMHAEIAPNY